jgi:hypothetical protein
VVASNVASLYAPQRFQTTQSTGVAEMKMHQHHDNEQKATRTQNPLVVTQWRFESSHRYQRLRPLSGGRFISAIRRVFRNSVILAALLAGPACAQQAPIRVEMYGDSTMVGITWANGAYHISAYNVPAQLQKLLTDSGHPATVTNFGVGGSTTSDLLNGTGGIPQPWFAAMMSSTASVIVINSGLNDSTYIAGGSESPSLVTSNYIALIQTALNFGKFVFVETPNPRNGSALTSAQAVAQAELEAVDTFPAGSNVVFIGQLHEDLVGFPDWANHLDPQYGMHPDDMFYTFKAAVDAARMIPYLGAP